MSAWVVTTPEGLWVTDSGGKPARHLEGLRPESLALDPHSPGRLYCGTSGHGLYRSSDAGRTWDRIGTDIPQQAFTAVAVSPVDANGSIGVAYAGTAPSSIYRSDDGGESWQELPALLELPSADTWSFPPQPDTNHVRWIEPDSVATGRLYVAIEAGALVRSSDGGHSWSDRVRGGPYDTHTAATHPQVPGRVCSAAGDGYFQSEDGGESWTEFDNGLEHFYLVGVTIDPRDPDTVVVSAASGPGVAYGAHRADATVYRRSGSSRFTPAMQGLPPSRGTVASRFAVETGGSIFAANNRGIFRSDDGGQSWSEVAIDWPDGAVGSAVSALVFLPD